MKLCGIARKPCRRRWSWTLLLRVAVVVVVHSGSPVTTTARAAFVPTVGGSTTSLVRCYNYQRNRNNNDNNRRLDKGFNLLEIATGIVPQGAIVGTAKEGYKFAWQRMMAELAPQDEQGNYQRPSYPFQGWIGPRPTISQTTTTTTTTTKRVFPDEPGRYHLYVGNPCPWCHRTVLAVRLLGFYHGDHDATRKSGTTANAIGVTVLQDDPVKASRGGWVFGASQPDPLGNRDLRELYDQLTPGSRYQGRCTAPLLVDRKARRIVSNESADIVRMLNGASLGVSHKSRDLYPPARASEIDTVNEWTYRLLNNAVYRCGFSTQQAAYDAASADVLEGLQRCEAILATQNYLCGDVFTEADLRLLPTILRFDGAYAPLFKAGGAHCRIGHYPALHRWMQRCWALPGVSDSIDLADACSSYYKQLFPLNPGGILPTPVTPEALGLP